MTEFTYILTDENDNEKFRTTKREEMVKRVNDPMNRPYLYWRIHLNKIGQWENVGCMLEDITEEDMAYV